MPVYRVKEWDNYQHYRDRSPPWIRLHRSLLDNYEYHCLPDASKALAPFLWLLASENKDPSSGSIDAPDEKIAFRLHMPLKAFRDALKPLIQGGFIIEEQDAITPLADRMPDATPETEAETEGERDTSRAKKPGVDDLSVDHVSDWLAKKRAEGKYLRHDEHFILDYFKNYCRSKGKKYADYAAGYRNAFEWDRCQPKSEQGGGFPRQQPTKADRARDAVVAGLLAARGNPG